jgi:thiopeptide-type bacteriocin biosynthesis protein
VYAPLSRFLLRAPLLPTAALARAARALTAHPLGAAAIAVASPTLASAAAGPARDRSITRYARRAAFRTTPSGLLAGVCLGELGPKTEIATGQATPHLAPSWARVDALAQALLHEPAIRDRVRLRAAPSVWTAGAEVSWVGPGEELYLPCTADLDGARALAAVLAATTDWAPWPAVRAHAQAAQPEAGDLDELLRALVQDGLLQTDLSPPLIGPPPASHLRDRLAALGRQTEARALDEAGAAFEAGDLARGRALWMALPGRAAPDVTAVLTLHPRKTPRLERAAVARAARLVPLLCRLQQALAPPLAERFAARVWNDAFDASTEIFGAGAFALGPLAAGDYGVDAEDADAGADATVAAPPPALLVLLCDAIADAARAKRQQATLELTALEAALAELEGTPLPLTAELFLVPAPRPTGTPAGTGWLLGLHAPAGASLGRFVHALGAPLAAACAEITAAERRLRPDEERVDVAFAPSAALADLCTHPPIRPRTLALSRWSAAGDDLVAADLELEADPSDPQGLTLRAPGPAGAAGAQAVPDATTIVPSPLLRARSATAAPGAARLLVGWSLQRQHAPWAFTPGPLADLAFLPRIVVDGFVIAPASWRLPPALRQGGKPAGGARALGRWRRAAGVPRMVQVGEGDQLYPVDLQAPGAAADLAAYDRLFEIWPPIASVVDRDGRRVEAIVAVVDEAVDEKTAPPAPRAPRLGRVPPPRQEPPLAGWRTFKLFGASARQDTLLTEAVLPAVNEARAAAEIDAWFFLRYLDGPGTRPHLRLRARAGAAEGDLAAFERRLRRALVPARAAGTLASLETGDYFPERGRFLAGELAAVHAIFESDSEAVSALLADLELDRISALPLLFDALARGLGLDLAARHALGRERRRAAEAWTGLDAEARKESDAVFRHHARTLRAALGAEQASNPLLGHHQARVAAAAGSLTETDRARLLSTLPTLLHLSAVRLLGPDPDAERLGYTFWERTLEGLRKSR